MTGNRLLAFVAGVSLFAIVPASAQNPQVARGEYLVTGPLACGNCHTPKDAQLQPKANLALAGGEKFNSPVFGLAYSKNLTPDVDTGIGAWSSDQIVRAIREGVSREGATLGPPMPVRLYNKMSNDDANAVAAYLKSLKPVRNEVPEAKYKIPLNPQPAAAGAPAPPQTDKVAYGGYLTTVAHCFECHTPPGEGGRPDAAKFGAGGRTFFPVEGKPVRSPNITSDKDTGIGNWTDAQIKTAIMQGIDKDGRQLIPQMPYPYFKNLTASDADAIVAYLRTVPAVANPLPRNPSLQTYLQ